MVRSYIDYLPVITKHDFADFLKALENVLWELVEEGLKVNS